jgi:general secretion pathway protein L
VTSLGTEKCFTDVKSSRISQMVGAERQKYVVEFDLKCPEDIKDTKKKTGAAGSSSAAPSATGGK